MKRRIGAILICFALLLGIAAQADNSATIDQLPGSQPIDVQGTYLSAEDPNQHTVPLQDDAYVIETEEGSLAVIPADPEADKW